MTKQAITFPVGRLVQGGLYKHRDTDDKGQPLVVKTGANKGQPTKQWYFAVAIAKTPGHTHWSQTEWGQKVLLAGAEGYPQMYQNPAFSWKIDDGDSRVPNKKGRIPAENEGWPGHWVVKFSGSAMPPRVVHRDSTGRVTDLLAEGAVKLGYYVQVGGECVDNKPSESPGVYMNYSAVLFAGIGPEIFTGPDVDTMFGAAPAALPPGASAVPAGIAAMPAMAAPPVQMPGTVVPPFQAPAAPVAPTLVAPNPAFLAIPAVGAVAPTPLPPAAPVTPPAAPAAPAGPTPTTKLLGIGHTVASMLAAGWTLDALRAEQYIV